MTAAIGVGLIGLGTVGSAVARRLIDEWESEPVGGGHLGDQHRTATPQPLGSLSPQVDRLSERACSSLTVGVFPVAFRKR
jgi:hypothetical protein